MSVRQKYILRLLLPLALSYGCSPISKMYVKFGEVQQTLNTQSQQDGVIRLFFDRKGKLYPDTLITDRTMKAWDSQLDKVYKNNPQLFQAILAKYRLNANTTADALQTTQVLLAAALINNRSKNKKLVFLIHGYNKHPVRPANSSASEEYRLMREKITMKYPDVAFQFVEIYWDGCTKENASDLMFTNSLKIWNNAQAASNNVGLGLRKILSKIEQKESYVVTHSLGASVITCALFNVDKFSYVIGRKKELNKFREDILNKYKDIDQYRTPVNNFIVGMIAPAIPGKNTFDEFFYRTPETRYPEFNYIFLVGLNVNDRVLRKFVNRPAWLGSTTLGCKPAEVNEVKRQVNKPAQRSVYDVNMSFANNSQRQKEHAWFFYTQYNDRIDAFLEGLFDPSSIRNN